MNITPYPLSALKAAKGKPTIPVRVSATRRLVWLSSFVPIRYITRASMLWATQNPGEVFDQVKAMKFGDELYWRESHTWVVQADEDLWRRVGWEADQVPSVAMRSWTRGQLLAFVVQSVPIEALANVPLKNGVTRAPPLPENLRGPKVPDSMRGPSTFVGAAPSPTHLKRTVVRAPPQPKTISEPERVRALVAAGEWVVPRVGSNPNP